MVAISYKQLGTSCNFEDKSQKFLHSNLKLHIYLLTTQVVNFSESMLRSHKKFLEVSMGYFCTKGHHIISRRFVRWNQKWFNKVIQKRKRDPSHTTLKKVTSDAGRRLHCNHKHWLTTLISFLDALHKSILLHEAPCILRHYRYSTTNNMASITNLG